MKRANIELELLTDVSVPESSRTFGGAESLDFLPGRTLWGAAATAAYRSGMPEDRAFRLFHLGAVRFLDAVPSANGVRCVCTPRSWHGRKYGDDVLNLCVEEARSRAKGQQYSAISQGWRLPSTREEVVVAKRYTLRTSVAADGRPRTGLLFGLDAMAAGTVLRSAIVGTEEDVDAVLPFVLRSDLRLGRSKSAEFGLVRARIVKETGPALDLVNGSAKRIHFLCNGRAAFRDERTGSLTFAPTPGQLGLPDTWRFDEAASFVRTTSYSPFNACRRRPELEKHVFERGSVLTFFGEAPVDLESVRQRTAKGVGVALNEGLGEVVVQPKWLTEVVVNVPRSPAGTPAGRPAPTAPNDALFRWAQQRADERTETRQAQAWVDEAGQRFERFGLKPSQWGELRRLAIHARHRNDGPVWLEKRMREFVEQGVNSLSGGWGKRMGDKTARDLLLEIARDCHEQLPSRLERLAARCMRLGTEGER
jgi:hypothetical protein